MGDDAAFRRLCQELEAWEGAGELTMVDILNLPDSLRQLVNWVLRAGDVGVHELAAHLGQDEAVVASLLGDLSRKGLVAEQHVAGQARYRVRTQDRRRQRSPSNVWRALE